MTRRKGNPLLFSAGSRRTVAKSKNIYVRPFYLMHRLLPVLKSSVCFFTLFTQYDFKNLLVIAGLCRKLPMAVAYTLLKTWFAIRRNKKCTQTRVPSTLTAPILVTTKELGMLLQFLHEVNRTGTTKVRVNA